MIGMRSRYLLAFPLAILIVASASTTALAAQFRSQVYPVALTGEQVVKQKLKTSGGTVKCQDAALTGTLSGPSSTASLAPTYAGCTAFGLEGKITAHSCRYVLHITGEAAPYGGTMDIACEGKDQLEVTAGSCTVKIPSQSALSGIEVESTGSGSNAKIAVSWNVTGLAYTEGAGCSAPGTRANGTYTGSASIGAPGGYGVYVASEQIEAHTISAEAYPATTTGTDPGVYLTTNEGSMYCGKVNLQGDLAGAAEFLTTAAAWTAPCAEASWEYAVAMNGCEFVTHLVNAEGGEGLLGVTCAQSGHGITLSNPYGCVVTFPPQQGEPISIENTGSGVGREIHVEASGTGLEYTVGSGCRSTAGSYENGTLWAEWSLAGSDELGEGVGVWIG